MKSYWRSIAAPIIRKVILETKGKTEKEIRKALIEAYPFGERAMHPYKIWCDEIRNQRELKAKKKTEQLKQQGQEELF
jgi:hypothetical protein